MKSITYWRGKGAGFGLTVAHSGNGTATAEVVNNQIVCHFTDLGSEEIVTINTPFSFDVIDAALIVDNGQQVGSKTLTVKNDTTALSSTLSMATDKGLTRATTIDEDEASFAVDDNDLKLVSSAHGDGDATVYISFK